MRLQNLIKVSGSGDSRSKKGVYQSGQMGQTVNLLTYVFGGSNPSAPTGSAEYNEHFAGFTRKRGSSSAGRAIAFQAIGREFEPRLPLHSESKPCPIERACFWGFRAGSFGR